MKKYIPLDFDEKGKVILGREKNTPTPNGTIPAIFIPNGSDENKQGLKSISISPAIQTTPALDSLFPIYWEDLTDEEKEHGKEIKVPTVNGLPTGELTITITPTPDWYALNMSTHEFGDMGEPITTTVESDSSYEVLQIVVAACNSNTFDQQTNELVGVHINIYNNGGQ